MTWNEFIHMGGYGAYVWSAYGLTAIVLIWNLVSTWLRKREVFKTLQRSLKQQENLP